MASVLQVSVNLPQQCCFEGNSNSMCRRGQTYEEMSADSSCLNRAARAYRARSIGMALRAEPFRLRAVYLLTRGWS